MKAEQELDAKIAEEVMGWKHSPKGMAWWAKDGTAPYSTNGIITNRKVWRPSTNIAHAWEVVKKMRREHDCRFRVWDTDEFVHVKFHPVHHKGKPNETWSYQENVSIRHLDIDKATSLAICLAALKTVGTSE